MKLPTNLFNEDELNEIKKAKVGIDFNKEYTDDEIADLEFELKQACLDYGFTKCKPNNKCQIWERICDIFIEETDKLFL